MEPRETETIQGLLFQVAKQNPTALALADSSGAKVNFSEAITKAVFLSGRLAQVWKDQKNVGILIPPSVGGALVNWAALMMGKVPVNLNYTLSQEGIISCIDQCGLTDVVVSGKLMGRLKLKLPVRVHILEDMATNPRFSEKLRAFFLSKFSSTEGLLRKLGGADVTARILLFQPWGLIAGGGRDWRVCKSPVVGTGDRGPDGV